MASSFVIKQLDRRSWLRCRLEDDTGAAVNLGAALSVAFSLRLAGGGAVKISVQPAVVEDAAAGIVRYEWAALDTDTVGEYEGEFEVTWTTGITQTFPTNEATGGPYVTVAIVDDVA